MVQGTESLSLELFDTEGRRHLLIAERGLLLQREDGVSHGPWRFRTEDDREIIYDRERERFAIQPDILLTAESSREIERLHDNGI